MLALPEVRNNLLEYQNLHPDGLHSLYVYEIASQGQRWDVPEVIYNQVESFGGVIRSDGVIGGVTGATSPHTNIALPAEHLRAYLSRTMLDGQQRDVIFPHEYENGKVSPHLVGSEATAPGHTMTLMWRETENGRRETITTAEIGNLPIAEQDKYWEVWQQCVLHQMNMYRVMYNDPEWRESNNIPPIDQLPTEKLLTDMTPTIHLVGYADRDQQQLTGLIRGAQSMSEWHASTLSMPYMYLPYEVKEVNAREVYKQVSPLDTCLFDVMKHMMEGVTEHDGYYVRSIGNVTRKLEEYPHMRPSYEGIEMFGVTSPDSMATVDIPFVVANRLMARDISRLSDIYQMGFDYFVQYYSYMGDELTQEFFKESFAEYVRIHMREKMAEGFMPNNDMEEIMPKLIETVFNTFKPTYQQVVLLLEDQYSLTPKSRRYLTNLRNKYEKRNARLKNQEYFARVGERLAGQSGLDKNGQLVLASMARDQVYNPKNKDEHQLPEYTMPRRFSASVVAEFTCDDASVPMDELRVHMISIDVSNSLQGASENLLGGTLRRPENLTK